MDLDELRRHQSRPVLTPGDHDYAAAAARTWGPPAAPDVLVQPTSVAETAAALRWAGEHGVEVAVRSGGHGVWAPQPGGLLIDLGAFDGVEVLEGHVVRVGAGCTWGRVAEHLGAYGLAISSGDTGSVGVGGNALGGGVGWLVRSVGLTLDQVVAMELATVAGETFTVSETQHPDLFFALRGGGGNFGVVTRFDIRAASVPAVVHAHATIETSALASVLRRVRDEMRSAPRPLAVSLTTMPAMAPGSASVPMLELLWAGPDEAAGRAAFAPLTAIDGVGPITPQVVPYAAALSEPPPAPPGPPPVRFGSNGVWARLPDDVLDRAADALATHPASMFAVRFLGGALADTDPSATAIAWRDAEALLHWFAVLPNGAPTEEIERVRRLWAPVTDGADAICGTFTLDPNAPDVLERLYPPDTLTRLRALKRRWDPNGLLRRNLTIRTS